MLNSLKNLLKVVIAVVRLVWTLLGALFALALTAAVAAVALALVLAPWQASAFGVHTHSPADLLRAAAALVGAAMLLRMQQLMVAAFE